MKSDDPRFFALKDALRVALVMPTSFALALVVFDSPQMSLFAAFGPMALLVFVQFAGPWRTRLLAYAVLALVGAALIVLGTLCSHTPWAATVAMALVGFAVIFAGVFDGYVAAAQVGAILAFVLAVMVPADAADLPARLAGWGLAAGLSTAAVLLLWPRRPQSALRRSLGRVATALAELAEAGARGDRDGVAAGSATVRAMLKEARRRFVSLPHRPSGNGGRTAALARTIEHMGWLRGFAARAPIEDDLRIAAERREIEAAVPELLRQIAARFGGAPRSAGPHPERLRRAHQALGEAVLESFAAIPADADEARASAGLDEAYRLRQLAFGVLQLSEDTAFACGDPVPGERLERAQTRARETRQVTRAQAGIHSIWLRNSLRGAVGLAAAVLVAQVTDVQNGFWVVLGTLSVLRSNALSTGSTVIWALLGTFAGILVGGLLIALVGTDPAVLWPLLPFAVFFAGFAPRAISFAAGQAAFSVVVLILFNLIDPVGWEVGLVRVQDVAIGTAISLLTGLLLWPRGATAVVREAIGAAYVDAAAYLDATIRALLEGADPAALAGARQAAFESSQQLDTTIRAYLSEQSSGRGGVEQLGLLGAGATRLRRVARLLGHAQVLVRLRPLEHDLPRLAAARRAFDRERQARCQWFERLGTAIAESAPAPEPEPAVVDDPAARVVLERAGPGVPPGLAIAWAERHLQALREIEPVMAAAAASLRR